MTKTICQIQYTRKNKNRKNGDEDEKALYYLMSNARYGKAMVNVKNRIDVRLLNNKKRRFKMYIKTKLYF